MVKFKSWKDTYFFIKEYANFSCLNCYYSGKKEATEETGYSRVFCIYHIAMVELAFQICCGEWKHKDTGESLEEHMDEDMWNLSDEELELLNKHEEKLSIEDIKEIFRNESERTGETA